MNDGKLLLPQELFAEAVMNPVEPPAVVVMLVVVDVPVHPLGNVHE